MLVPDKLIDKQDKEMDWQAGQGNILNLAIVISLRPKFHLYIRQQLLYPVHKYKAFDLTTTTLKWPNCLF